ncbi:MAG: ABC transporter permease [Candidatus Hydrogenedentota bacterium]
MSQQANERFDTRLMGAILRRWGAGFAVLMLASVVLRNLSAMGHIGWYLMNLTAPENLVWPGSVEVLFGAGAVWLAVWVWAGFRAGPGGLYAAGWSVVLWLGLFLGMGLLELSVKNGESLQHLGWYIGHGQLPAEMHGIVGGRLLIFAFYAWLMGVVVVSQWNIKRPLLALMFILLLGVLFSGGGSFYKWDTHRDMLRHSSRYGILACGMTLVIITGGIDLAVGSVLGLVAVVSAILTIHWGWSPWLAAPACMLIGGACGSTSGVLVARFRMQPFIATLAMMVFARGLAKFVSGGEKISRSIMAEEGFTFVELPGLYKILNARVFGGNVAVITVLFLACVGVSWFLLARLRVGRYLYAVGGNEEAARLSGVPVGTTKVLAYALSGVFAGVAGICQAAQETQGDPNAGMTYELTTIAIVVIGGTNLMGGRGSILLTLLGTLTIGYLEKILSINAVEEAGRLMLTGAIIVTAVLLQRNKE